MKKILVQFDGSNFYNKVKTLLPGTHLTTFNYLELTKFLTKVSSNSINYYVGEIRRQEKSNKSKTLYSSQQSLFSKLRLQKIVIKLGYLLFSSGKFHEKGVDVQIAVDMVKGAIKNEFDICYLISSDTDLLPAIKIAKEENKKIVYVGFEKSISKALMKNCSSSIILKKKDLLPFTKVK